jgi:hypothetical protein
MKLLKIISLSLLTMTGVGAIAQEFDASLQLRPRYEYRNGFSKLIANGESPTSFVSQRSRLNMNFKQDKLKTKLSLQNIRTWGDVATTTQTDKNGVAVFEAWGQYDLNPDWNVRLGRQVISYDNQRIMGEIDWIQQGQSHDALVFSYHKKSNQLDLGFALNAAAENNLAPTTPYTLNYKAMQYAWYHTQLDKISASFLFLNTGYQYAKTPSDLEVDYKQTFGTYLVFKDKKWDANLGVYAQTGKSVGQDVNAWTAAANLMYVASTNFKVGLGYEYLSGKDQDDSSAGFKSFTPLFGTNHAFNGYMDYFYVKNHVNSVGLQDVFLKLNYSANKWQFNLIPHIFNAANTVLDGSNNKMDSYLGTEVDLTASYAVQKDIMVSGGYSQMFGSSTLERINGVVNPANTNNWAWLMVSISPKLFSIK